MKRPEGPPQFNPESESGQSPKRAVEHAINEPTAKIKKVIEWTKGYLEYKKLKIKERFGHLSQKDFDHLLALDFKEQLKDTPPINGIFSPEEELAKIKKLPREHKEKALVEFKEKLARQREALAALRVFIERSIEFDHDVPKEKLMEQIEKFSSQYGFNSQQRQIAEKLIDRYYENRQKVLAIREKFPDNHELVKALTGVSLNRNDVIHVSVGPMTIDIAVNGFNSGRLYNKSGKPIIGFRYGGFSSQSIGKNPIFYIVINNDKWVGLARYGGDLSGKRRRNHEYEHQKNTLFRTVFEHKRAPRALSDYRLEQDPKIKKIILKDFLSAHRAVALERAKDEITASLYDRNLTILQMQLDELFFSGKEAYDYLAYLRNWEKLKDDPFYQEMAQRMLVQEYKKIIRKAVDSYAKLVKKGQFSTQEVTALLTDKPLEKWPKTINRLFKQRGLTRM